MKIVDAALRIIPDSRGEDTLEAKLTNEDFSAVASVPSGKSRGTHEAFVLNPKEAIREFESIKSQFINRDFQNQDEFDNFLISLDGTPDKKNLGGNLILALSLAWARLKAKTERVELFRYIAQCSGGSMSQKLNESMLGHRTSLSLPRPIFNVINGGSHARNNLSFQEFQIIPEVSNFDMAFNSSKEFYKELKEFLERKFGKENVSLGDEAGFSAPFENNEEALEIMSELIASHHYPLRIGLDVAASQFFHVADEARLPAGRQGYQADSRGYYLVDGKKYSTEELKDYYLELIKKYNLLSIEDPFCEDAFDPFASLTADLYGLKRINTDNKISINPFNQHKSVLVITDDLTTTNPERFKIAIGKKSGNTILIKPNQIGTLTETLRVVEMAYSNGWQTVVSHRSGETLDDFIADLAVGIAAWGIKSGAPARPERLAKYERLLEIGKD